MIFRPIPILMRPLKAWVIFYFMVCRLMAAATGPTLQFDYGNGRPLDNPLNKFMYFVPLISPEPLSPKLTDVRQNANSGTERMHIFKGPRHRPPICRYSALPYWSVTMQRAVPVLIGLAIALVTAQAQSN